jgi:hypothetical protein
MLALADPEEGLEVGTSFFWKLKNYVYMYISVSEIRLKSVIFLFWTSFLSGTSLPFKIVWIRT